MKIVFWLIYRPKRQKVGKNLTFLAECDKI